MSVVETNPSELFGGVWESIQEKFLFGAGTTYSAGATGGEATHTLTETEMPSHTHTMSGSTNAATPSGMRVSGSTSSSGSHSHSVDDRWTGSTSSGSWLARGSGSPDYRWGPTSRSTSTGYAGSHSHTINASISGGSHSHTINASLGSTGSGQAHNNMPPYLAVYMWRRTA